jgi:hypothetical protein
MGRETQPAAGRTGRPGRVPAWVNWLLALLTVPGAGAVMVFAFVELMGTDRCASAPCRNQGPGGFFFDLLLWAPPVVALVTIAVSFYTATRARGILVPLCGLALLLADVAVLAFSFRP